VEKALIYREASAEQQARGDFQGSLHEVDLEYFKFDYRHSTIKHSRELVLKVWLRLTPGDTAAGVEEVRKIIASRAGKHPSGKSAGSFFKNPSPNSVGEGLSAGFVSDQCGFKGKHMGGAFISEKHGNFLMNDGTATMFDVLELCLAIQRAGYEKFGVKLEREVALLGETGYIVDEFDQGNI
jgi:UDP-N-acetylmuramate dehydrogenase